MDDVKIGRRFFLVDPLDGTKEFITGGGDFTVNIALLDRFRPVMGVIYAPVTDTLWYGATGEDGLPKPDAVSGSVTGMPNPGESTPNPGQPVDVPPVDELDVPADIVPVDGEAATARLTYSGIGVFRPALLDRWQDTVRDTATGSVPRFPLAPLLRAAMRCGQIDGTHHRGLWMDVGTAERLDEVRALRAG